jgi:predicted phage tail protein
VAKSAEAVVEESKDALQPLEKWPDEVKTLFSSLDGKAKQFLLDREKDVESHLTKRTQELSEVQKRYTRLDDVLKPYDEVAKRQGVDLTPHIAQALQHYMAYQRDPASTLKQLIQASQLSPEQLFGQEDNADPAIRALRTDLVQTKNEVAQLKQGQTQVSESQLTQQIQAFKDAKNEKGEPQNPHFERVRHLMAPLVAEGKSMQDAYNEVVWAVPEHREAVAKAEREKSEKEAKAKAERERVAKVKNAKRAETLPSSDADKGTAPKKARNWEEALRETRNRLTN